MIPAATHGAVLVSAFVIFWFLALFCLFPVGLSAVDPQSGAPLSPRLGLKALIATGIAAALWLIFYGLILMGVFHL